MEFSQLSVDFKNAVDLHRRVIQCVSDRALGERAHAAQIMGAFKWGPAFMALNFPEEAL